MSGDALAVRIAASRGATRFDIAFAAPLDGITALFGASGAGKSTVLAAVAGLWRPADARIAFGADTLQDGRHFVPPERRGFATVFQEARLFPHLTVADNLRYGARRATGTGRPAVAFAEVVALLGIAPLLDRRPATLSGGERQRVAIGRALLARPRMLLMDEPLAALDAPRKADIVASLLRLQARFRVPILYVTHATEEVAALADTIVLLDAGRVVAAGPAAGIAAAASLPLASRGDAAALLRGRVAAHDPARGLTAVDCAGTTLVLPLVDAALGTVLRLRVPAREVILAGEAPGAISLHNILAAEVAALGAAVGAELTVELRLPGGAALLARVTADAIRRLELHPGRPVLALVKSTSIAIMGRDSE